MGANGGVRMGRVYDEIDPADGQRVLVDRLWPRGFHRDDARVGRWMPEVAPSNELRRWYGHEPAKFKEFATRYTAELATGDGPAALTELRTLASAGTITLVTATKEVAGSQVAVLAGLLV